MRIYVGNLAFSTTEADVQELFSQHGEVSSVVLPMDRETGRPRGFGFVEMTEDGQAREAIEAINGQEFGGRRLTVNEAKPREERSGGGGFGGGGGGRGRGGFGGGGGGRGGYGGGGGGGGGYGGGRDNRGGGW